MRVSVAQITRGPRRAASALLAALTRLLGALLRFARRNRALLLVLLVLGVGAAVWSKRHQVVAYDPYAREGMDDEGGDEGWDGDDVIPLDELDGPDAPVADAGSGLVLRAFGSSDDKDKCRKRANSRWSDGQCKCESGWKWDSGSKACKSRTTGNNGITLDNMRDHILAANGLPTGNSSACEKNVGGRYKGGFCYVPRKSGWTKGECYPGTKGGDFEGCRLEDYKAYAAAKNPKSGGGGAAAAASGGDGKGRGAAPVSSNPAPSGCTVRVYRNKDHGGDHKDFGWGVHSLGSLGNEASSVKVSGGCYAWLYDSSLTSGTPIRVFNNKNLAEVTIGSGDWQDRASYIAVCDRNRCPDVKLFDTKDNKDGNPGTTNDRKK